MEDIDFIVTRLSQDQLVTAFDCGDQDLNDFLLNDAMDYQNRLLAVTYLIKSYNDIIGYISLANDKISVADSNKSNWRKIKRKFHRSKHRCDYPAVKVGRLAVGIKYQDKDIGTKILDYIKCSFVDNNRTGCAFVTVDALRKVLPFYFKNNFRCLDDSQLMSDSRTVQLYFDLAELI